MGDSGARARVLAALASGLATDQQLADSSGLPVATVEDELIAAEADGLVSRIDLPGTTTWRITGAGLLEGLVPTPAPAPLPIVISAAQPLAAGQLRDAQAAQAAPAPADPVEPAASEADHPEAPPGPDAPVSEAGRGWARRWLRYAYDQDRLHSEQVAARLDAVESATTLRELDHALRDLVRVPVVEEAERA